jgi:uncharacterized membrane protein YccC
MRITAVGECAQIAAGIALGLWVGNHIESHQSLTVPVVAMLGFMFFGLLVAGDWAAAAVGALAARLFGLRGEVNHKEVR